MGRRFIPLLINLRNLSGFDLYQGLFSPLSYLYYVHSMREIQPSPHCLSDQAFAFIMYILPNSAEALSYSDSLNPNSLNNSGRTREKALKGLMALFQTIYNIDSDHCILKEIEKIVDNASLYNVSVSEYLVHNSRFYSRKASSLAVLLSHQFGTYVQAVSDKVRAVASWDVVDEFLNKSYNEYKSDSEADRFAMTGLDSSCADAFRTM